MRKKLTLSIDEQIYKDLHLLLPNRKISEFVENRMKKMKKEDPVEEGFKMMAKDTKREDEALEWCDVGIGEDL